MAQSLSNLGFIATKTNNVKLAKSLYLESLDINRAAQNKFGISTCLFELGKLLFHDRDYDGAKLFFEEFVELNRETNDRKNRERVVSALSHVASALGHLHKIAHEGEDDELANTLYWEREGALERYNEYNG